MTGRLAGAQRRAVHEVEGLLRRTPLGRRLKESAEREVETDVVTGAYGALLNRAPDPQGLEHWREALRGGLSVQQFLVFMMESGEWDAHPWKVLDNVEADVEISLSTRRPDGGPVRLVGPSSDASVIRPLLASGGSWEPHVTTALTALLGEGDVFLDVGANLGYFSLIAASLVGPGGRVLAFEPAPTTRGYLMRSVERNGFANVEVRPEALWSEAGAMTLMETPRLGGSHLATEAEGSGRAVEVPLAALDGLRGEGALSIDRLHLVKMDIEGAEPFALAGMERVLREFRPTIICELNPTCLPSLGSSSAELFERFGALGYRLAVLDMDGRRARGASGLPAGVVAGPIDDAASMEGAAGALEPVDLIAIPHERAR